MTEKYEFIDGEAGNFPVQQMCIWAGVSTSGFYHWGSRPLSATAKRRAELRAVILQVFSDSQETYGYRRVHAALQRMNVQAGAELVRALMRELGLVPCQPRPWRATTTADDAAPATPDLLAGSVTVPHPGTVCRLLGSLEGDALDTAIGAFLTARSRPVHHDARDRSHPLRAIAVDGKTVRGSRTPTRSATVLLAAMAHTGEVLAQRQIADKSNEIPSFSPLLETLDLTATVITADALHTQHEHAA
ncbi:IS3 family transposase [Streptomyces mirabilis]|uniref:IS3 family transposase n=1 Tax=Streptomyces mirabilis TaxID=68239 RepID=UPI0033C6DBD4